MNLHYHVIIDSPHQHTVKVKMQLTLEPSAQWPAYFELFLPSWSPGSYLMREYSRHLSRLSICWGNGQEIYYQQKAKGMWLVDTKLIPIENKQNKILIEYQMYCHELTVRTSHVDYSHAFLHGPSYLMGLLNQNQQSKISLSLKFPEHWSKITTALKDTSVERSVFSYEAQNYDQLLDCPIEIGCHETDGFKVMGKDHFLAFYGQSWPHNQNLKNDIRLIVEYISRYMDSMPYDHYTFITHFIANGYGGLEHENSTVLMFDGRKLQNRDEYLHWLTLVAHEYFHLWNVKRIRPKELGPFNYCEENYTTMLWLSEGLTSFMDNYFVYKMNLMSEDEYLNMIKKDINRFLQTYGRKVESAEGSSFNAWIKLYRPDENSQNSSVSYYLKGSLVFLCLQARLLSIGKNIKEFNHMLWQRYLANPAIGLDDQEVINMVKKISNDQIAQEFVGMISTTEDLPIEKALNQMGIDVVWDDQFILELGIDVEFKEERVFVKSVSVDSSAYKCGLNAGDEILAINKLRILRSDWNSLDKLWVKNTNYQFTLSRLGLLTEINLMFETKKKLIKNLKLTDRKKFDLY